VNESYLMSAVVKNEDVCEKRATSVAAESTVTDKPLHPAWRAFIRYCAELQHGEIEILKIQNGLPSLAEVIRKKVKFSP
jgi:hypothetical protein